MFVLRALYRILNENFESNVAYITCYTKFRIETHFKYKYPRNSMTLTKLSVFLIPSSWISPFPSYGNSDACTIMIVDWEKSFYFVLIHLRLLDDFQWLCNIQIAWSSCFLRRLFRRRERGVGVGTRLKERNFSELRCCKSTFKIFANLWAVC